MLAGVFGLLFGHGTGVLCAHGCVWPGVWARKWCVRPQKGGDLRTKSSGSRFYPQKEGILRTMFVGEGAHP